MSLMQSKETLKRGDEAPGFTLKGVDGQMYMLNQFKEAKAILIIFMCNHCPYVKPKIGELKRLQEKFGDSGLLIIAINSNESENYPEDSFQNMVKVAQEQNFNFLYLHDETQGVAKKYGAVCTPDPFLFDSNMKLVYHGRLDDALSPAERPTEFYMDMAIGQLLTGQKVHVGFLPSQGCSIKWKK